MNDTQPARTMQTQLNHRHVFGWAVALICDLVRDTNHNPKLKKK